MADFEKVTRITYRESPGVLTIYLDWGGAEESVSVGMTVHYAAAQLRRLAATLEYTAGARMEKRKSANVKNQGQP